MLMTHLWSGPWPRAVTEFLNHPNSLMASIRFTTEIESDSAIPFLDGLVIRKGTTLATKVCRKPTHTGRYLTSDLTNPRMWKEVSFRVLTIELLPYPNNDKICLIKLVTWDVIFSSVLIPKISFARLSIPGVAVGRITRKSLWVLYISHMWRVFQKSSIV
jgi:hypothetical protein